MTDDSVSRQRFQELEKKRIAIEEEIKAYTEVLESNRNVGMHGSLVDVEGFPRNDIDLVAVRTARNKIICLNTDHKAVMKELEALAMKLLQPKSSDGCGEKRETAKADPSESQHAPPPPSFLKVDKVVHGSPADLAGVRVGDEVTRIGRIHAGNFGGLASIANLVKSVDPKDKIPVQLLRKDGETTSVHHLTLVKPEDGKSLGFHVVPLK